MQNSNFRHVVSRILIYNPENFSIVENIPVEKWKQSIRIHNQSINNNKDLSKKINSIDTDSDCNPVVYNQSYFPELQLKISQQTNSNFLLYRTNFNQTYICLNHDLINQQDWTFPFICLHYLEE